MWAANLAVCLRADVVWAGVARVPGLRPEPVILFAVGPGGMCRRKAARHFRPRLGGDPVEARHGSRSGRSVASGGEWVGRCLQTVERARVVD